MPMVPTPVRSTGSCMVRRCHHRAPRAWCCSHPRRCCRGVRDGRQRRMEVHRGRVRGRDAAVHIRGLDHIVRGYKGWTGCGPLPTSPWSQLRTGVPVPSGQVACTMACVDLQMVVRGGHHQLIRLMHLHQRITTQPCTSESSRGRSRARPPRFAGPLVVVVCNDRSVLEGAHSPGWPGIAPRSHFQGSHRGSPRCRRRNIDAERFHHVHRHRVLVDRSHCPGPRSPRTRWSRSAWPPGRDKGLQLKLTPTWRGGPLSTVQSNALPPVARKGQSRAGCRDIDHGGGGGR